MTINFKNNFWKNSLLAIGLIVILLSIAFPFALAQTANPISVNHPQTVDFSYIDTILGVVAGAVATIIVFGFIGWLLVKSKAISLTKISEKTDSHSPSEFCLQHIALAKDASFTIEECKSIWLEIKDINKRQMELRQRLPENYVSKNDLKEIQDKLKTIDDKLDRYLEFSINK